MPLATGVLLAFTALLPHLHLTGFLDVGALSVGIWLSFAVFALAVRRASQRRRDGGAVPSREPKRWSDAGQLVLYLSPVLLLSVVYPIASRRLVGAEVGGESLSSLLLASAVTVPWLSQAVCLPLYRALGSLPSPAARAEVEDCFLQIWPAVLAKSAPIVLVFAVAVEFVHRWSPAALGTYVALCLLHVLFSQALVPGNTRSDRVLWAAAWTVYAAALFIAPTHWYLPPLLGMATQLVPMLARGRRALRLQSVPVAADVGTGLLLGSVLWVDKFVLFLRAGDGFAVSAVFAALLPAVLAYNFYFVRLAPMVNRAVGDMRKAMETQPHNQLVGRSRQLAAGVFRSIHLTALLCAGLTCVVTVVTAELHPSLTPVVAAVSMASWLFLLITILSYKLDYIGQKWPTLVAGAVHLVLTVTLLFAITPIGRAYLVLAVLDVPTFLLVAWGCRRQWSTPEYAFFWRHATAW